MDGSPAAGRAGMTAPAERTIMLRTSRPRRQGDVLSVPDLNIETVLAVLIAAQVWMVALLFLYLAWHRFVREWREERRERRIDRLADVLRRWAEGALPDRRVPDQLAEEGDVQTAWEALERVWPELEDRDRAELAGLIRDSAWYDGVRDAATSLFWWRRLDGCQALQYLAGRDDAALLAELLEDRKGVVRMAAVFAARERTLPELVEPLLARLVDAPPIQKSAVADALLAYGDDLTPVLRQRLEEADEPDRLASYLILAADVPDHADATPLVGRVAALTSHDHREVRIKAVKALAGFPEDEAVGALRSALADQHWAVRAQAARALGVRRARGSLGALRRALGDETWWVRLRAAISLRLLGPEGMQALRSVSAEDDPYAHDMAQYVLRLDDRAVRGQMA